MIASLRKSKSLREDRRGVTALEYGLIAALMAAVIVGVFTTFGNALTTTFSNIKTDLTTPSTGTGTGTGTGAGG